MMITPRDLNKRRQRGSGAFEVAMVLIVGAMIAAGTLWVILASKDKIDVVAVKDHIELVHEAVQKMTLTSPDYSNVTTANLIASGLLPPRILDTAANEILNPIRGNTWVWNYTDGMSCPAGNCSNHYMIEVGGLSSTEQCVKLATSGLFDTGYGFYIRNKATGVDTPASQNTIATCQAAGAKSILMRFY